MQVWTPKPKKLYPQLLKFQNDCTAKFQNESRIKTHDSSIGNWSFKNKNS